MNPYNFLISLGHSSLGHTLLDMLPRKRFFSQLAATAWVVFLVGCDSDDIPVTTPDDTAGGASSSLGISNSSTPALSSNESLSSVDNSNISAPTTDSSIIVQSSEMAHSSDNSLGSGSASSSSSLINNASSSSFTISSSSAPRTGIADNHDDWLRVKGNQLVDLWGNRVRMTGANWFGYASQEALFGLDEDRPLAEHLLDMAEQGINTLRIPITTELTLKWKNGASSYSNFTDLVAAAKQYGVKIIIDMHGALQDPQTHEYPVWFRGQITEDKFFEGWKWLAQEYKDDDTVIGFDLQNEPHGWAGNIGYGQNDPNIYACWGRTAGGDAACPDHLNWAFVAQKLAKEILEIHPNILIIVEGVEVANGEWFWWGGNLSGVAQNPLVLGQYQNRLVYSSHVYGPAVFEDQSWFKNGAGQFDFTKTGLYERKWRNMFGFIYEQEISHLFFGEWGGVTRTTDGDGRFAEQQALVDRNVQWMNAFAEYLIETQSSHTWWAYNPNSNDTGGLVDDDWRTWDSAKWRILEPTLWEENGEKVGLDHRVPLPGGTNVSEVYGINPDVDAPVLQ